MSGNWSSPAALRRRRQRRLVGLAAALLILLAAAMRLWSFTRPRPLWLDEAALALNLLDRGPLQLFGGLDYHQVAPIGYLWLCKATTSVLGPDVWVLRLPSLLASGAAVAAAWPLARSALRTWPARLAALGVAAADAIAIRYVGEFKPYTLDLLAATLVTWLAVEVVRGRCDARGVGWLGAAACILQLFSAPLVFTVAGVFAAAGAWSIWHRRWRTLGRLGAWSAAAAVVFATHYATVLRYAAADGGLVGYWRSAFPASPLTREGWASLVAFHGQLWEASGLGPSLLGGLALVGLAWLAARRRAVLAVLALPPVVYYAAALSGRYPPSPRLLLGLAPLLQVAVGAAFEWADAATALRRTTRRTVAALLAAAVVSQALWDSVTGLDAVIWPRPDMAALLRSVEAQARPGDRFYVAFNGKWVAEYHLRTRPALDLRRTGPVTFGRAWDEPAASMAADGRRLMEAAAADGGRAWLLFADEGAGGTFALEAMRLLGETSRPVASAEASKAFAVAYAARVTR